LFQGKEAASKLSAIKGSGKMQSFLRTELDGKKQNG
jgi:hypothetical protein